MNIFILLALILAATLILGRLIEKIRVPWVFAALFLGLLLSLHNPFPDITTSDTFNFLADLGMYFLLFIIGLELDIKEMMRQKKLMLKLSLSLVLAESILGSFFIHHFFGISWEIAILTASSFSTVGEAILIPILDEFQIVKTRFGQMLLGVGTLDDIVELITIILTSIVLGSTVGHSHLSISSNFILLGTLFLIPLSLQFFRDKIPHLQFKQIPPLLLFGLVVLFLFVGVGDLVESSALGAIFAGISLKNLLSEDKLKQFESIIKDITYGLFVPVFFLEIGLGVSLTYLFSNPLLILLVLAITNSTKIITSYLLAGKELGRKKAVLLGIGLSAKFSTSIVIVSMLHEQNLIPNELYSVLIGAMIMSKFIIPTSFSVLVKKMQFPRSDIYD